ncbi:MAG: malonate decarboxylase holo-[acyl-carrier-protein] synthase [Candidatus Accumulibacter sp.]|uniref:Malonate decarboxylase holo-[acyl-carrier-protein] synthase n=1 Tax=Candidatus Accumulibacter affinis TaxID=2954384 RepID=A0A935W5L6_9PROT|nr:malonate decarboxylase holo-[acyl-carrier-protein] synthase [Candidatus Accumulibacter affinis]
MQLALTLPQRLGRQRLACLVNREDVLLTRPPLAVGDCLPRLEIRTRAVLAELDATTQAAGARRGVFGSLAWEVLSGENYRHAESDIDLICDLRSHRQIDDSLQALRVAFARMTCRLDGELRFPGGDAVAWRELAACRHRPVGQVLIKGLYEVKLKPVAALLDSLLAEPAHA